MRLNCLKQAVPRRASLRGRGAIGVLCILVLILFNLSAAIAGVAAVPRGGVGTIEVCTASGMVVLDPLDGKTEEERRVCSSCPPFNHVGGAAFVAPVEPPLPSVIPERALRPAASRAAFGPPDVRATARAPPA